MASTQSFWTWDAQREKYYYYSLEAKSWIYEDGNCIPADDSTLKATGGSTAQLSSNYSVVQDAEASYGSLLTYSALQRSEDFLEIQDADISPRLLFPCPGSQVHHIIDPEEERISPLVCQHLFGPKSTCSEPWEHTHIELGRTAYSICLYRDHGTDKQTLVIDLCAAAEIETWVLKSKLTYATQKYQSFMSEQLAQSNTYLPSWYKFYAAELRHYTWLEVNNKILEVDSRIPVPYFVSGITCSHCERWTKLGGYCSRCSKPLKDQINCRASGAPEVENVENVENFEIFKSIVLAENAGEIIGGGMGGLTLGLTVGAYLLLSMLAQA